MELLGRYAMTTEFSNKDAGSCRWCFATCDGQEYFIKEFLEPKYPENDTESSAEKRAKKIQKCRIFEDKKTKICRTVNEHSDENTVYIAEFFRVGSKYYVAMPRVKAINIDIVELSKYPAGIKREICASIAHSVGKLHEGRFVHSDIKHSNILFEFSPTKKLVPKLIDYDAGFLETAPPTHPEEIAGDQVYFSPEAWKAMMGENAKLTCKMDVFALGILFHQYFTGKVPKYDDGKFSCAGEAVAQGGTLEVSKDMPVDLRLIISRMLLQNPMERPSLHEVHSILMMDVVPPPPPPPPKPPVNPIQGDSPGRGMWHSLGDL